MPPRRRTYRRRTYRRRRRAPGRMAVYSAAGSQLWRDVQKLKNFVNVEFKFVDNNTSGQVLSTTEFVQTLNNIAQGDSDDTRDGQAMRMKSIQCDGTIVRGSVDANVKLFWLLDLMPPLGPPAYTSIMNTVAGDITASLRNLDNRSRFVILREKQLYLTADRPHYTVNYYRRLDAKVFYSDATANYASVRKNGLVFLAVSNVAASGPTLNCKNRIRYIDN